jgi:hypothetical protein
MQNITFDQKMEIGATVIVDKALDPNSGRQQIMKVIYDHEGPITPAQISKILKDDGREVKYLHSHLNYFKSHGQLIHNEDKTYEITDKMLARLDALYS